MSIRTLSNGKMYFGVMKVLSFYDMQNRLVYRDNQMRCKDFYLKGTAKHNVNINVWGCFTASGVGDLHPIEGNINSTNKSFYIT